MVKKAKTQDEIDYHGRVAALGCILPDCRMPACVHHLRTGQGASMRANHYLVIPLCRKHHQGDFSIHASKRQFENIYGSELDLLAETIKLLNQ
jgi:hypothetical protein